MTISTHNLNKVFISLILLILLMIMMEPAFALNVEKIGKGVSGNTRRKMQTMREIVYYMGMFFSVLGVITYVFRHIYSIIKRSDINKNAGLYMLAFGLILMATKLI